MPEDAVIADAEAWFAAAIARRSAALCVEPETAAHLPFLTDLFVACSPLREMLPPAMLMQQAAAQQTGHRAQHPDAMRHIFLSEGSPVARLAVDWSPSGAIRLVDIAVLPQYQSAGIGSAIVEAIGEVADRQARPVALSVYRDNPAARLYARLGFVPAGDDGQDPAVEMVRDPRARSG